MKIEKKKRLDSTLSIEVELLGTSTSIASTKLVVNPAKIAAIRAAFFKDIFNLENPFLFDC